MTSTDPDPHPASSSVPHMAPPRSAHESFWIKELPFTPVLILTIAGVAYTSFSKKPIVGYWEILAPIIALVCVAAGWEEAGDKSGRLRLIVTQVLHWFAFLLVMNLMLLSSVQRIFTAQTTGSGGFHPPGARDLYRGRACALVAGLSSRPDHGAGYPGDCLD
jgi:hypothetical protein